MPQNAPIDLDALRTAPGAVSTPMQVNQRALIDKILARYASNYALYRELLQNSNDAGATVAEIRYEVQGHVTQVVYRNNGMPFRPQDWQRLQKVGWDLRLVDNDNNSL